MPHSHAQYNNDQCFLIVSFSFGTETHTPRYAADAAAARPRSAGGSKQKTARCANFIFLAIIASVLFLPRTYFSGGRERRLLAACLGTRRTRCFVLGVRCVMPSGICRLHTCAGGRRRLPYARGRARGDRGTGADDTERPSSNC